MDCQQLQELPITRLSLPGDSKKCVARTVLRVLTRGPFQRSSFSKGAL
ncbi:hypothetical protein UCMB321_1332 [Pseudomonas batumici]|uniref:Uncharacterized protein n=1 Tax=Pseudomonas batumici TaxID=226910 RepID=A0A0C2EG38_9PSED|nr:hypothetical protein UCMB321_1332 [Pseudomonas batumici]